MKPWLCVKRSPGCFGPSNFSFSMWTNGSRNMALIRCSQVRASCGMVPHGESTRHLDARQVGVSLVCRLGPGVPHDRALLSGYRFCKRPTRPDAADILPASNGANPGLRVEFQRRQSTGACMGFDLPVPDRAGLTRYKRFKVPRKILCQTDVEFQLVGESEGPLWKQFVRGWIPRFGQHRRL